MKDYQRIKQTKYILPKAVYHSVLWKIRDYYRLKDISEDMIHEKNNNNDIGGKNSNISDKVAFIVIKREKILKELKLIDLTLLEIPEEYRKGIWENIQYGKAFPLDAHRSTYGRYKAKFIYKLAKKLGLI